MERYNIKDVERKWQKYWSENKTYAAKIDKNKKILIVVALFIYLLYKAMGG